MVALLAVVACSEREATEVMARAERIVESDSAEALRLMEGVERSALRSDEARARYGLIYSEAYYYNYIDVDVDTLTRPMMLYYMESENHAERARAMFQHAVVAYNAGELAEAMVALTEAEKSLKRVANPKLYASVQRLKGNIYSEECLYANAYDAYVVAREAFAELGLEEHAHYLD